MRIAVLMASFNRRAITLAAIARLYELPSPFSLDIVVFDDTSPDGTAQAIAERFPEVHLLNGDGNAYWNGGMHQAWKSAQTLNPDAYLWLNDDVQLDIDCLAELSSGLQKAGGRRSDGLFILVGATRGLSSAISYGGFLRRPRWWTLAFDVAPLSANLKLVDTFNGNFVFIPASVVARIGINDPVYYHNMGDIDYGLRAKAAGISAFLLTKSIGLCAENIEKEHVGYGNARYSLFEQWHIVNKHHGFPFRSWFHLTHLHSGALFPIHFLIQYRWLIVPRWARRLYDSLRDRTRKPGLLNRC